MMLLVRRLDPNAKLPARATAQSVGYDLHAIEAVTIPPLVQKVIRTGIACVIPEGCYGRVAPRSGLAVKKGVDVLAGVIDPDYRGEIMVCLVSFHTEAVTIEPGDRIAQLIIERCETPTVVEVSEVAETERGASGFGSTGR